MWYPARVSAVGTVAIPFTPLSATYKTLEEIVKQDWRYTYQLYFRDHANSEVNIDPQTRRKNIWLMLNGLFRSEAEVAARSGTRQKKGKTNVATGMLDNFRELDPSLVWKDCPKVLDYYLTTGMSRGIPFEYYQTRRLNFCEELELLEKGRGVINKPCFFLGFTKDVVAPKGSPSRVLMNSVVSGTLDTAEVDGTHWALHERPEQCAEAIRGWLHKLEQRNGSRL